MLTAHQFLKKITPAIILTISLVSHEAKALSVGSLVASLNLEDCSKKCVIPIVARGHGQVELIIARYLQRPSGERVY